MAPKAHAESSNLGGISFIVMSIQFIISTCLSSQVPFCNPESASPQKHNQGGQEAGFALSMVWVISGGCIMSSPACRQTTIQSHSKHKKATDILLVMQKQSQLMLIPENTTASPVGGAMRSGLMPACSICTHVA